MRHMVNFSVDGISTANVRQNGALQDAYPSQEGIAAVKVTAFNNSAEFSQVGDVTFTTKGGTNQLSRQSRLNIYRTTLWMQGRTDSMGRLRSDFNTFGGSLGGPVSIPHLYNGQRQNILFC